MDFNSGSPQTVTFPAGIVGSTRCIQFDIIDDEVALENNESFNVDFEFVNGVGARKGAIPQSMVIIVDSDSMLICTAHCEEVSSVPHSLLQLSSFVNYNIHVYPFWLLILLSRLVVLTAGHLHCGSHSMCTEVQPTFILPTSYICERKIH